MGSNDRLIEEIATEVRNGKTQLELVLNQLNQLNRQKQIAKVTSDDLKSYPGDNIWRSCGRMFLLQKKNSYTDELASDLLSIDEQSRALDVKKQYLEVTVNNGLEALKKAVQQN